MADGTLGPTSTHTHDDLGMAVTNALASLAAGADLVHSTVNGIGERASNVALEEVAIALSEGYGVETIDTTDFYDLARAVADATGIPLAPNKAVVGENTFTHESGIHTDGQLKDDAMYEPYSPEKVGRERRLALAETVQGRERERQVELEDLTVAGGNGTPSASVRLFVDGDERTASGTGSGPVDAAVTAVRNALGPRGDATLDSYHVDAVTGGTDAVVTVEIEMARDEQSVSVAASDADITRASVEAMVEAFDRLLV